MSNIKYSINTIYQVLWITLAFQIGQLYAIANFPHPIDLSHHILVDLNGPWRCITLNAHHPINQPDDCIEMKKDLQ